MDGNIVSPVQECVKGDRLKVELFNALRFDIGVIDNDLHFHSLGPVSHDPADMSHADEPQCLVEKLLALELLLFPFAILE